MDHLHSILPSPIERFVGGGGGGGGGSRARSFRDRTFYPHHPFYALPITEISNLLDIRLTPRSSSRSVSRLAILRVAKYANPTNAYRANGSLFVAKLGKLGKRNFPPVEDWAGLNEFVLHPGIRIYLPLEPQRFSPLLRCFHLSIDTGRLSRPGDSAATPNSPVFLARAP